MELVCGDHIKFGLGHILNMSDTDCNVNYTHLGRSGIITFKPSFSKGKFAIFLIFCLVVLLFHVLSQVFCLPQVDESGRAFLAGVQEGDEVVSLNGEPCADLTLSQAFELIDTSIDCLQLLVKRYYCQYLCPEVFGKRFCKTDWNPWSQFSMLYLKKTPCMACHGVFKGKAPLLQFVLWKASTLELDHLYTR